MINALLWIWQLPQNLLGLILRLFYKTEKTLVYKGKTIRICSTFPGGVSLADTIFLKRYPHDQESWNDVKHEYGHSIQSKYLGCFYLLVIGIPSGLGNLWDRYAHKDWSYADSYNWYYNQPWEKWADKLGGVDRYKK